MRRPSRSLSFGFVAFSVWNGADHYCESWGFQVGSQRPLRYRRRSGAFPLNYKKSNDHSEEEHYIADKQPQLSLQSLSSSYQTALCVIPPDESWDTLQRARHFAGDQTYRQWPPAIRLFHPFCPRDMLSDVALEVIAHVIEKHNIQPFSITLNRWTVMPLPDNMPVLLDPSNTNVGATNVALNRGVDTTEEVAEADDDSPILFSNEPEYYEIQKLIESEAREGKIRKKRREERRRLKALQKQQKLEMENSSSSSSSSMMVAANNSTQTRTLEEETTTTTATMSKTTYSKKKTTYPTTKKYGAPYTAYDEFNGPAMIALEPDEKSSRKLQSLREILRRELFAHAMNDPAAYSVELWDSPVPLCADEDPFSGEGEENNNHHHSEESLMSFRPLIPIGAFPTTDAALQAARKLKGLWDPLTFEVTDLQFVSQVPKRVESATGDVAPPPSSPSSKKNNGNSNNKNKNVIKEDAFAEIPFGCDAQVMLVGEEIEMDDEANQILANHVWEQGTPGGHKSNKNKDNVDDDGGQEEDGENENSNDWREEILDRERKLLAKDGDWEELMDWLDEDDDDEEVETMGTTVVIGRTHMYSGERRMYEGMPASSIVEENEASFTAGGGTFGPDAPLWDENIDL